ncbi:unnamed protein product, partial [Vitis vinifera]
MYFQNNTLISEFIFVDLQGCHKGDKVEGIHKLKKYLGQFGYLSYSHSKYHTHANDDDFDDLVESAIKTYQTNYHLNATGSLDSETVSQMVKPRCGAADIINGTNWMRSPRWPPSKTYLTYAFLPGTPSWAMSPVSRAFGQWDSATHFTFGSIQDHTSADMTISFHRLDHGDGYPFDGPGGTIAHAFAPTNGRFHYDGDETWSIGAVPNAMDLETVALHEIGHLLGLGHSSVQNAIMFPSISSGVTKGLHEDDIQGISALYNR